MDVGFEPERMLAILEREKLRPRYLLNTHAHYDHVAAMKEIQAATGAEYWLHPEDQPLLSALRTQGAMFGLPPADPPTDVHALYDGQEIALGDERLLVIHTPGHSPGSVTFRSGDDLWVGDVLFAGSVGRTDLPFTDWDTLVESIRLLMERYPPETVVYSGHGPPTTLGVERERNPFLTALRT